MCAYLALDTLLTSPLLPRGSMNPGLQELPIPQTKAEIQMTIL